MFIEKFNIYKYLKEYTYYKEGNLYWKKSPRRGVSVDSLVGKNYTNNQGYKMATIKGKLWLIHRLIYIYHFKTIHNVIDHIDRNYLNNNINNLRDVTLSVNSRNSKIPKTNTSGTKNISLDKRRNTWNVEFSINGQRYRKSGFLTINDAKNYLGTKRYETRR
jgi:hypothetical protein